MTEKSEQQLIQQAVSLQAAHILCAVGKLADVLIMPTWLSIAVFRAANAAEKIVANGHLHQFFELHPDVELEQLKMLIREVQAQTDIAVQLAEDVNV